MSVALFTTPALLAMQSAHAIRGTQIAKPARSQASELPGPDAFNVPFAGGQRSAAFVNELARSMGLTEQGMSALAQELALNYS